MRLQELTEYFEELAPTSLADDFDNVGLLVGRQNAELTGVLCTLDVDLAVAREATSLEANLIIAHHPIMFNPVKQINDTKEEGKLLLYLTENKINVYAAHTNFDRAPGGLNDFLVNKLDLGEVLAGENEPFRLIGLREPMSLKDLTNRVKALFSLENIRASGDGESLVKTLALCSGGGGGCLEDVLKLKCDAYVTGDVKYNQARAALEEGTAIIDLPHYESELPAAAAIQDAIRIKFDVPCFVSKANRNIYNYY